VGDAPEDGTFRRQAKVNLEGRQVSVPEAQGRIRAFDKVANDSLLAARGNLCAIQALSFALKNVLRIKLI
jgi:hypothetical protein